MARLKGLYAMYLKKIGLWFMIDMRIENRI